MTQYASSLDGKVIGFFESDEIPEDVAGYVYTAISEPIIGYPIAPTKTSELLINTETGELSWLETATLSEIKVSKNAEINAKRLAVNRSTFNYLGKQIACDELSRSDIDAINGIVAVTQALPPGWVGGWKAVDNTYVPITTVMQWIGFYGAMVTQGSSNFAHAQALKAQLASATSVAEVAEIQWET